MIALLAVYGTALVCAVLAYFSWRDSNVSRIEVSTQSDLEKEFEIGDSTLRVKNPEFLKVCFVGDYVYALKDARYWFAADETELFGHIVQVASPISHCLYYKIPRCAYTGASISCNGKMKPTVISY